VVDVTLVTTFSVVVEAGVVTVCAVVWTFSVVAPSVVTAVVCTVVVAEMIKILRERLIIKEC
jgi:hypothetical protein